MTLLTRNSDASMDTSTGQFAPQLTGLICGEDIDPAAPCYIKNADGLVYMADGTALDEKTKQYAGFSPRAAKSGQPITLFGTGARFSYGSALSIGIGLFIGATKGRLDSAATTGCWHPIARTISATDIVVTMLQVLPVSP